MSESQSDVLVLGAGVVGLTCAHYLLKAGRSVTVIDQGALGQGASHGNCGTITPSHSAPLAMPGMVGKALRWMLRKDAPFRVAPRLDPALLAWMLRFAKHCNWKDFHRANRQRAAILQQSRQLLADLVRDEKLDCEFVESGTLHVFLSQRELDAYAWHADALREVGIPVELLDGAQVRELEPILRDEVIGGMRHRGDAQLRPDRYVAELARVVRAQGGDIVEHCAATGFDVGNGRITRVQTASGPRRAREVVLALGAWSPLLARQLGLHIPVQPGKGYSITYTRPNQANRMPLTLSEASVCVTAWPSGYRLGSTMEFAGYDTSLNRVRLDALRRGAALYLREPEGPQCVEEWYGWRPMTHDDLPILGRSDRVDNLTLATGHGMLGVSMSAASGLLVSDLLCGRSPSLDPAPYDPARFAL
ncbi:MAG: FAD-dependent oxidoreductase [Tahibacter sp.]